MGVFRFLRSRKVLRAVLWVLHVLAVIAVAVGLWWLNARWDLPAALVSPFRGLHPYWLPLLFLLAYAGGWLAWWFVRLLIEAADDTYPDVAAAWRDGLAEVTRAGIDPTRVPLFVVAGRPAGGDSAAVFAASGLPFAVRGAPDRPDAPVRVYASTDAIYVTSDGASALSAFAGVVGAQGESQLTAAGSPAVLDHADLTPTVSEVTADDAEPPIDLFPAVAEATVAGLPADEADRQADRFRFLCRLVARARRPFCPANGLVWLVPAAATDDPVTAAGAAAACHRDVAAAEAGLQAVCPAVAVVCDADRWPGVRDLAAAVPPAVRHTRFLGRTLPLVPAVAATDREAVVRSGLGWLSDVLLPRLAYQRLTPGDDANRCPAANARLVRLLDEVATRRAALARVVAEGLCRDPDRPPMVAGVYLAGTGPDAADQGFVAGPLRQLAGLQNHVAWTADALAANRDYRRMTWLGYATAVLLTVGVVAFGIVTWQR